MFSNNPRDYNYMHFVRCRHVELIGLNIDKEALESEPHLRAFINKIGILDFVVNADDSISMEVPKRLMAFTEEKMKRLYQIFCSQEESELNAVSTARP